jgi:hypothetical protein
LTAAISDIFHLPKWYTFDELGLSKRYVILWKEN